MKTKRTFIPVFTLSVALLLTACNGKEAADTKKTQTTQTESGTEPDFFRSCGCMEQGVWHDE